MKLTLREQVALAIGVQAGQKIMATLLDMDTVPGHVRRSVGFAFVKHFGADMLAGPWRECENEFFADGNAIINEAIVADIIRNADEN